MAGIYIHIPFCKSKCRYCDFTSYPSKLAFADAYMACVYKEMKLRAKDLSDKSFDTVYIGGGTPSVIDGKYIAGCMNQIRKLYKLSANAEITVEINPGTLTNEKAEAYKRAGINRFSIGLQSSSDVLLEEIGRAHNAAQYLEACEMLGDANKSADIMIGLKGQTVSDVLGSIDFALRGGVRHVSVYALTPEDGTPVYSDYLNGELPDGDEVAAMYDAARGCLKERGFARYEVSNFAVPGFESRHNLNYWRRGEYIGFGVSASSFMGGRRFTNTPDLDEYIKCILTDFYPVVDNEKIEGEDAKFEYVMLALRTEKGLSAEDYSAVFGSDFFKDFSKPLERQKNYLAFENGYVRIREEYLYVQNTVIIDFLQQQQ